MATRKEYFGAGSYVLMDSGLVTHGLVNLTAAPIWVSNNDDTDIPCWITSR